MPPARPHDASSVYPFGPVADVPGRPLVIDPDVYLLWDERGQPTLGIFAETLQIEERSTFEKVSDALGSRDALIFYLGAFIGSLGFALMCVVWAL